MFFIDEVHKRNYHELMDAYGRVPGKDPEYEVTFYIAAVPEIRKCISRSALKKCLDEEVTPLLALTNWEEDGELKFTADGLTGSTRQMAMFGMSLYNSFEISAASVFSYAGTSEYFNVLQQAIHIYTRQS